MPFIQLRHHKRLGYAGSSRDSLPTVPASVRALSRLATVVSFRPLASGRPDRIVSKVHACARQPAVTGDLVLVGIENDSPLAPLLLWDYAHGLSVGKTITVRGETLRPTYLERDYFKSALAVERDDADGLVLRKLQRLPAERDSGLDRWSFCIPVGPDDATHLNVIVKRILELDVPTKEILLCGRPGANFLYFDHVRIVGEDIPAPPVRISTKKNRLAQEAQYENLCIIHDRVFLPPDFHRAARRFGDNYPFTTLQSLYFDDKFNAIGRRYSDFNQSARVLSQSLRGLLRDNDVAHPSPFATSTMAVAESQGYHYANALRHSRTVCATGSLYICKRAVWLACPQDERLFWAEFEDIEHGSRADEMGVPTRVNPFAITQSVSGRPLLTSAGSFPYESMGGSIKTFRSWLEPFRVPRKPLLKVSSGQAQIQLARFATRHNAAGIPALASAAVSVNTRLRVRALVQTVHRVRVPIQRKALDALLADYDKQLSFDQPLHGWQDKTKQSVLRQGSQALLGIVSENRMMISQYSLRPRGEIFFDDLTDYLPRRSPALWLGSALSAAAFSLRNRGVVYLPGNVFTRFRAILRTTPYLDYSKAGR